MGSKPHPTGLAMQKQVRENVTEVQNFLSDLSSWSMEMKAKELANSDTLIIPPTPPVESSVPLRNDPNVIVKKEKVIKAETDYTNWEKFDAEKACEEVDEEKGGGDGPHNNKLGGGEARVDNEEEAVRRRAIELRLQTMANEKKELGNLCLKEKNYEKAVEYYTEGIRCDKKSAVLSANRAQAYIFLKQYDKAVEDCTDSITKDPSYIKAYFRRAKARFQLRKLVDAKNDLNYTLKLEPNNVDAKQLLNEINRKTMQSLLSPTSGTPPLAPKIQNQFFPARSGDSGHNPTPSLHFRNPPPFIIPRDEEEAEEKPDTESYPKPIYPVDKPAALCSKRPLLPIHIKVVGDKLKLDCNGNEGSSSSNTSSGLTTPTEAASPPRPSTSLPSLFSQLQMTSVPPKPKTAAQFNLDWKKLRPHPKFCAQYLHKFKFEDYRIFGESMEYGRLSEILDLLVWEFLPNRWDISCHLNGISSVRRFATLALFMTEKDRANARKLISECPSSVQPDLYKKYSLV